MSGAALSGWQAARILGRVGRRRLLRGRAPWVLGLLGIVPMSLAAGLGKGLAGEWREFFNAIAIYLALLPPTLVGGAVSDELEDRTYTYLWSRPIPRGSLLAGKLLAGAPIALFLSLGWTAATFGAALKAEAGANVGLLVDALIAVGAGSLAFSLVAGGIAAIVPRLAQRLIYVYVFAIDLMVGQLPFSLRQISISYQVRQLAGVELDKLGQPEQSIARGLLACALIGGVWIALGALRLRRSEPGQIDR